VLVRLVQPDQGVRVDPATILALAPPEPEPEPGHDSKAAVALDLERLRSALAVIPSDEREVWLRCGMALQTRGLRALWDEWSQTSDKFDEIEQAKAWDSFRDDGGVTIATIFAFPIKRGWRAPPQFVDIGTDCGM
jgi:hypothetical protein